MSDLVDSISEGRTVECPYSNCNETRMDLDPGVANALIKNHIRRDHPLEEE